MFLCFKSIFKVQTCLRTVQNGCQFANCVIIGLNCWQYHVAKSASSFRLSCLGV